MAKGKNVVVRTNKNFTMYKQVIRLRGRGSKFQWNAKSRYVITKANSMLPIKVFKTFEEADKEWVYMILKN
jgi:hypothetical protein